MSLIFIFHLFFLKENYLMSWILKAKEALFQVQLQCLNATVSVKAT